MRISNWVKPLRFLIALCVVNLLLSFLLEPARGSSDTMWSEYYKEDKIDIAFVGASFCAAAFNPVVVDDILKVNSFNMGTPLQAIGQTLSSVETLIKEHDVDTIILGTGFFVLQYETLDEAELTFEKARASKKHGISAVKDVLDYIFDEDVRNSEKSINYFFPWTYNREILTVEYIKNNINNKIARYKGEVKEGKSSKGFRPYHGIVDYNKAWEVNSYWYYEPYFLEGKVEEFKRILALCKENNVDIIVVNTPHPTFDVISCYQTYAESEQKMASICKDYGIDYFNYSLAKSELFDSKPEYYYDFEHLNMEGAKAFSESICELLMMRKEGEVLDNYFYSVEEYYGLHADLLAEWKEVETPR